MLPAPRAEPGASQLSSASSRLTAALETATPDQLPLQAAATQGGLIDPASTVLTLLGSRLDDQVIEATIGVMFTEIVGGCSCGEAPFSVNGWCRLRLRIEGDQPPHWSLLPD